VKRASSKRSAPVVVLSSGDPCGIGPEVTEKALRTMRNREFVAVVAGDAAQMPARWERVGPPPWTPRPPGTVLAWEVSKLVPADRRPGKPSIAAGRAQLAYVDAAIDAVLAKAADAIVTAPVSKKAIVDAHEGMEFVGHTEHLALRAGDPPVAMMFHGPKLKIALATTHISLAEVPGALTTARIVEVGQLLAAALTRWFGIARPHIGVAALNPHAGEGGMFGDEEGRIVAPAVQALRRQGRFDGPIPADAVFRQAADGKLDAVVALYHDQATMPVKLLDFQQAVNVTLGLPFVRTSVDHGVAYDIAGKGVAEAASLRAAIRLAASLVK
jgi:4-hydroxythreonine-4-phosphate dehydrogenase